MEEAGNEPLEVERIGQPQVVQRFAAPESM